MEWFVVVRSLISTTSSSLLERKECMEIDILRVLSAAACVVEGCFGLVECVHHHSCGLVPSVVDVGDESSEAPMSLALL